MAEALVTLGTGFTSAEDYPFRDVFGWQVHFKARRTMYPHIWICVNHISAAV